ncbi:hypothetical protein C8F04DRAFT_1062843 [Mycena alexandri]|uniref:Uncharacterized protein n=1 Tax=Mycena alexandri TaxID=1745969 RepID=A0AAD6TIB9_9AGAR|nr:hypothetical protein C8F04DRAFT_1062843 [Mycena alexandri]
MPASTLQSRISAFESLSSPLQQPIQPRVIPSTPPRASPSPSPPNLGRKSSLIDVKIDLRDWVLDDGSNDSLIHFSPPKSPTIKPPPPLPPRKQDSLSAHTYPPAPESPRGQAHAHASSVSSFHSVSLSPSTPDFPPPSPNSTTTPTAAHHTTGSSASTSSFEELSASAAIVSPASSALISHDWEKAMARRVPPKLPARPSVAVAFSPPPQARRSAPPPPPSIRSVSSASSVNSSSIKSQSPSTTGTSRAPPIPPAPRKRYDALFTTLVAAHVHAHANQKPALLGAPKRRAAGWRGLSVDLIRDPGGDNEGGEGEMLPGPVIRVLWARSRLPVAVLSAIWCVVLLSLTCSLSCFHDV